MKKQRNYAIPGSLSDYYLSLKHLESKAETVWGREVDQREKQTPFCSESHLSRTLLKRWVREE